MLDQMHVLTTLSISPGSFFFLEAGQPQGLQTCTGSPVPSLLPPPVITGLFPTSELFSARILSALGPRRSVGGGIGSAASTLRGTSGRMSLSKKEYSPQAIFHNENEKQRLNGSGGELNWELAPPASSEHEPATSPYCVSIASSLRWYLEWDSDIHVTIPTFQCLHEEHIK
ncbi:actin-associated protein FAM107A isoform X7 [Bubalus kerabau]|uniref:actin-associated protein FAM107A isoform X7 n=1 Tax=Bubalus carabanensis TaxID=3119969 RepID=UPI00244EE177|nr:actin-associated protein FAM107A isoform X7 [Bubalus carabanensis]